MRDLVVSGVLMCVLMCVLLVAAADEGCGQSRTDTLSAAMAEPDGSNFDVRSMSKAVGEMASRLKDDVAQKAKKLKELESDLKKNQQSGGNVQKDIGEIVLILNGAADELAPDSPYRGTLEREAVGLRGAAIQAEVDLDRSTRQKAPYLRQKVADIETAERDAEELRTRLVTQIDLLEGLRRRAQFAGTVARVEEPLKNAQGYLDGIEGLVARTERLATELYSHEGGVSNATPVPTAQPSVARQPPFAASSAASPEPPTTFPVQPAGDY